MNKPVKIFFLDINKLILFKKLHACIKINWNY